MSTRVLNKVAATAKRVEVAVGERDAAIVAAREEGFSLRAIGAAAGLTHSGVSKILERLEVA